MVIGTEHRVDSYHVNIGVGDCAIHVHSQVTGVDSLDYRRVIARERRHLVLVDGGYAEQDEDGPGSIHPSGQFWNLDSLFKLIREVYTVPVNENRDEVRFDAVVITHWDVDHYSGIFYLLEHELNNTIPLIPADSMWERGACRPSMFKYDSKGHPLTILYVPVSPPARLLRDPVGDGGGPLGVGRRVGDSVYISYRYKLYGGKGRDSVTIRDMIQLRQGEKDLLGTDLFSGNQLSLPPVYVQSLSGLVIANPPPPREPGLYCIMVRQQMLGSSGTSSLSPREANYNNKTSIALIIAWKSQSIRASHYFAGDLDGKAEERLSPWIGTTIRTMKASHHGAFTSTPVRMLEYLQPHNIIISSGTKYGHPRWELIALLWYYDLLHHPGVHKPIYSTRYPYFFVKSGLEYTNFPEISVDELREGSTLRKSIQSLCESAGALAPGSKSPFDIELQQWISGLGPAATRNDFYQFAMRKAEQCWGELSHVVANTLLILDEGVWRSDIQPFNQVAYLRVESIDSEEDGGIYTRYSGTFKEHTFNQIMEDVIESDAFEREIGEPRLHFYEPAP